MKKIIYFEMKHINVLLFHGCFWPDLPRWGYLAPSLIRFKRLGLFGLLFIGFLILVAQ